MNVLRNSNPDVIGFLGGFQTRKLDINYRLNKYCYILKRDRFSYIYNIFTGGVVTLFPFELDNIYTKTKCDYVDHLVNNYYLVPENFQEDLWIDSYRDQRQRPITNNYLESPSDFTILTTTKCNARCPYCYESNIDNRHDMTIETANKVADYIISQANNLQPIHIGWFGGEPLYNYEVINVIISKVRAAGFNLSSSMVSNGYLFNNDEIFFLAQNVWGLDNVQITLDGDEEKYNKVKKYIYSDDPSPFKTVINNIHKLTEHNIYVSIRLNCGVYNYEEMKNLINFLGKEFKGNEKVNVYIWEIFTNTPRSEEDASKLYSILTELEKLCISNKLNYSRPLEYGIKWGHCMVDSGTGVTIDPSGNLGVCEHYPDSGFIGHINNPHYKNLEILKSWRNYVSSEKCLNCILRPTCLKMEKCTDQFICTEAERNYLIWILGRQLDDLNEAFQNSIIQEKDQCICKQCKQN